MNIIRRLLANWRAWQQERDNRARQKAQDLKENRDGIDRAWVDAVKKMEDADTPE